MTTCITVFCENVQISSNVNAPHNKRLSPDEKIGYRILANPAHLLAKLWNILVKLTNLLANLNHILAKPVNILAKTRFFYTDCIYIPRIMH